MGLSGAPLTAMTLMTDLLREYIGVTCSVFMDDICVHTKTYAEHCAVLHAVLRILRKEDLHVSLKKCSFLRKNVRFLGHMVGVDGVRALPERCAAIRDWPRPKTIKELRSFLGLCSYYRRFVPLFANIAGPLTALLRQDSAFATDPDAWPDAAQAAFEELKKRLTEPPVLALCSKDGDLVLRTDASNYALGAVLYQRSSDGLFRPLEFRSKRMTPAQCNYAAHDRELLAVIYAFRELRSYLVHREFVVETDNSALSQFLKSRELSPKFQRWLAAIGEMQCTFRHRPGSSMTDADAFSRPPEGLPDCKSPAVDPEQMLEAWSIQAPHQATTYASQKTLAKALGYVRLKENLWVSHKHVPAYWAHVYSENAQIGNPTHKGVASLKTRTAYTELPTENDSVGRLLATAPDAHISVLGGGWKHRIPPQTDADTPPLSPATGAKNAARSPETARQGGGRLDVRWHHRDASKWQAEYAASGDFSNLWNDGGGAKGFLVKDGLLFKVVDDGTTDQTLLLCVPSSARKDYLREIHDGHWAGHRGVDKTYALARSKMWWPSLKKDIREHVRTCDTCQRNKWVRSKTAGKAKALPVPTQPWDTIGIDFVGPLPRSKGYDAIMTVVCHLTGMVHLVACKTTDSAREVADNYLREIVRLHGLPRRVVSDRDPKFTSRFWKTFCERLGTRLAMSTAFHPQTDGKVERANAVLEEVLRCYCHQTEQDWAQFLPSTEFAINNSHSDAIGMTPFMANYGFEPLGPWAVTPSNLDMPDVEARIAMLQEVHELCRNALRRAKDRMLRYAANRRREVTYQVGDRVLIATKHLSLPLDNTRRKLACVYIGPFEVTKGGDSAVTVDLPPELARTGLHPTFNVARVRPYYPRLGAAPTTVPKTVFVGNEEQEIIDFLLARRTALDGSEPEYLVRWKGHGSSEDTWVSANDVCPAARANYDNLHPAAHALASDQPDIDDDDAFPPTFTTTENVTGPVGVTTPRRARDWFGPRDTRRPESRRVVNAPPSATTRRAATRSSRR